MVRNLVLCCDGTANEFAKHRTNVVKLYSILDHDLQRTYYHPGLGTMEPAGALTTIARKVTKLMGMAFGYGLRDDVRDAYIFLMRHCEPADRVFMFGFSRGAYTVRAVASLLRMYGLIRPGNEPLVPYAIRMLLAIDRAREKGSGGQTVEDYFRLAEEFRTQMACVKCKPYFVGAWDTVSSVGWVENQLHLPFIADNSDIQIGRHAIAIDERRAFFRSHLWRPSPLVSEHGPLESKQVWFPGVHCDVGGGYPESESGLSKLALEWMICEAKAAGLLVDPTKETEVLGRTQGTSYAQPDPNAKAHESLTGSWRFAEFVPKKHYDWKRRKWHRRMNRSRRRTIPAGSLVHESAYRRDEGYSNRLPKDAIPVATDRRWLSNAST